MSKKIPMTAVILAGGKSSRMGKDKALLPFGDGSVLEHLARLLDSIFEQTLIIVDDRTKYLALDLPEGFFFEDLIQDQGPLGGLATGLVYASFPSCFVATCDMPLIHERFIRSIVKAWQAETCEALCILNPADSWEPFPGIYHRENRSLIQVLMDLGHLSMQRLFEVISVESWAMPEEYRDILINMNTPAEYAAVLEKRKVLCGQ
jgi:molybdopterin-guanine dinucleotide biosynthesis protein A